MSCTCSNPNPPGHAFACPCDRPEHPRRLVIGAGLDALPRQIAGFAEFRRAMLFALPNKTPLLYWQARRQDDLGVMLLEMWAYVCDSLAFYDQVIAQEAYLRTARRRPSLRRLVALLGYLPRPAVGATVSLAALAEGRQPITLPAGTAFRSAGFDGNPPQVFELDADTRIHPFTNRWNIRPPRPGVIGVGNPDALLVLPRAEIKPDDRLLLVDLVNAARNQPLRAAQPVPYTDPEGRIYAQIQLQAPAQLDATAELTHLRLLLPTQAMGLWTRGGTPATIGQAGGLATIALDGLYRHLKAGEYLLIARQQESRWYKIREVTEEVRSQGPGSTVTINGAAFTMPGVSVPVTRLTLDAPLNDPGRKPPGTADWTEAQRGELVVHGGMQTAGLLADAPKTTLAPGDRLEPAGPVERPEGEWEPRRFLLQDKNRRAVAVDGQISFPGGVLRPDPDSGWQPELALPVTVFGNVVSASRGERVNDELLGSGNASRANQTFKLKKKPLTYLPAPTADDDQAVESTLEVRVNGVRWREVRSFYGKGPGDPVYIVRQNDEGHSRVTFGDGVRGMRLPTGASNVVASYRFGAGRAAPPAGAVNQVGRPVKGLQSVQNPLPAAGGADAASADDVRDDAPRSALLLGRAVSMDDLTAAAHSVPGVRFAQAEWRWHGTRQCPVVHVWYIGDAGIGEGLLQRLRKVTDPTTPIRVEAAQAVPVTLTVDVALAPGYHPAGVVAELRRTLTDPRHGWLIPEKRGIGRPLFRSQLFAAVLSVAGTAAVRGLLWNAAPFTEFAKPTGAGTYFDFPEGSLRLNATI